MNGNLKGNQSSCEFEKVTNVQSLLPILEDRLPRSANILNIALNYPNFPSESAFYTLNLSSNNNGENDGLVQIENSWILATFEREDDGTETFISGPKGATWGPEISQALLKTEAIIWDKPYKHVIDREFSQEFFKLSVFHKGNPVITRPCTYYYLTREEALQKSQEVEQEVNLMSKSHQNLQLVAGLDPQKGGQFFHKTYKYTKNRTEEVCHKFTEKSISTGVLLNKEIVSGSVLKGSGFMGFLYTEEKFRSKGFGHLTIKKLMGELAVKGFVPCSTVEITNHGSNLFHEKIGLRASHYIDFFLYNGPDDF